MFQRKNISIKDIEVELKSLVNSNRIKSPSLLGFSETLKNLPKIVFGFKGQFELSIQASSNHYCIPRNDTGPFTAVELGFPNFNFSEEFIKKYAEDSEDPQDTVYAAVPLDILSKEIFNLLQDTSMSILDNAKYELSANKVADENTKSLEEAAVFFERNWGAEPTIVVKLDDYCGTQFSIVCDGGTFMLKPLPVSSLDEATVEAIKAVTSALED